LGCEAAVSVGVLEVPKGFEGSRSVAAKLEHKVADLGGSGVGHALEIHVVGDACNERLVAFDVTGLYNPISSGFLRVEEALLLLSVAVDEVSCALGAQDLGMNGLAGAKRAKKLGRIGYEVVLDVGGVECIARRVYDWKTDKVRAGRVVIGPIWTGMWVQFEVLLGNEGHVV
jgi:hypothetical protein